MTKQLFLLSSVKTRGNFFEIFVAFLEKLNFNDYLLICSPDPATNPKQQIKNFHKLCDQSKQVFRFLFLFLFNYFIKKTKKTIQLVENRDICENSGFGIGCWIWWARCYEIFLKYYLWIKLLQLQHYLELDNLCCKFLIGHCMGIFPIPRFLPLRIFRFSGLLSNFSIKLTDSLAESFYYVNHGLSIIPSKVCQIISVMKTWTDVFVAFKTKHESKCQNKLFLKCHFSGNTRFNVFITEIVWQTFDLIIDDP